MPYTTNQDVRIHYRVEGNGPVLVLQHGFFGSIDDWYEYGYVSQLRQAHRVILIDARGHGKSDKPYQPSQYDLQLHAGDVIAVMDELNVNKFHYLGFSMGGRIGFALARYHPSRLCSMILMGTHPYPVDMIPIMEASENMGSWVPEATNLSLAHKERLLKNDCRALLAAAKSHHQTENSEVLKMIDFPCLVLAGDSDEDFEKAKQSSEEIVGSTFVCLEGLGHVDTLVQKDIILPNIIRFLSKEI